MISKRIVYLCTFTLLLLASCGPVAAPPPQTIVAPQTLPPTWTPTQPTAIPTVTEYPTFTPVPAFTPLGTPTPDFMEVLGERFQDSLFSPNGKWVAYRDPDKLRVVNTEDKTRVWTLPCELFVECSTVYPVVWSKNAQILYFAAAPTTGGAPTGISLVTAMGRITVKTGEWEIVLPESDHHYDFTFSPEMDYLAYTQSSGVEADKPEIIVGIIPMGDKKLPRPFHKMHAAYAGNIIWSPFKPRFVFITYDPDKGSGVGYYDLATDYLKYALEVAPRDIILSKWGRDNLVSLEEKDWLTHLRAYRVLNPFTGELIGESITATPKN